MVDSLDDVAPWTRSSLELARVGVVDQAVSESFNAQEAPFGGEGFRDFPQFKVGEGSFLEVHRMNGFSGAISLHGDAFREIPRLVDLTSTDAGDVVGEEVERDYRRDGVDERMEPSFGIPRYRPWLGP